MSLRIVIVDDHESVRRGIRLLLGRRSDWLVCGEAADGLEATELARELRPDLILMDVSMPRMNGIEATRIIRREVPETQVIIVSQNDPDLISRQAEEVRARGCVSKAAISCDLIPAIEEIARGINTKTSLAPSPPGLQGLSWLKGGGEMGDVMRATDWSRTPLGDPDTWSPALRMMSKFMLANRFSQLLWWGPQFCCLYNDAYVPILGEKHPWAIGRPVKEVWHEIWHILQPLIETPFQGGPATWMEDIPLEIKRRGFFEETHFTIAYSPVPDETVPGGIGGVLATVHEITDKVIGERRVSLLRDLGARPVEPKSAEEACKIAAETLSHHPKDVPFALLYVLDGSRQARLVCGAGIDVNDRGCPNLVDIASENDREIWPMSKVLKTEKIEFVRDLGVKFDNIPPGSWSDPPQAAAVVPVRSNISHKLAGFLIVGLSARLQFDEKYQDFLALMSTQIATSIANARAYEEERKRAQALAEIDRAKTVFFSNVSHEFRTPLTLMLGPLEDALAASANLPVEQRDRLDVAHRNSLRLLKLVNALLDFSRIEAGRIQACYEPTDLSLLTAELSSVSVPQLNALECAWRLILPQLPELVYVDRAMWEKIILNLLSNAFKFTFEGEIAVSVRAIDSMVETTVRDTGIGIPADEIPRVFERFHRVKGARGRSYEGSGIGLALVEELIRLHGGTVRVESEMGHGATFRVSIPFGKDHLPADRIGSNRTLASTDLRSEAFVEEALSWLPNQLNSETDAISSASLLSSKSLAADASVPSIGPSAIESSGSSLSAIPISKRPCVLIADDNSDMREYLRRLLNNYDVEVVSDGQAAVEAAFKSPPDLVLTDVMMPRVDGFDLLRKLRSDERTASIPVILLSARSGEESRVEGVSAGADDYIVKPFSARELTARIETHLKLSRFRRETAERERFLRREAEQNELNFRKIIETTPQCVKIVRPDGTLENMNQAGLGMVGAPSAEMVVNKSVYTLIAPEDRDRFKAFNERICAGERGVLQFDIIGLEGKRLHMESHAAPLRYPDGTVVHLAITNDISERKQAEDALRQSEERFRALVNATSYVVYRMSPDWSEMRQLDGGDFISDTGEPRKDWLREYIHPEDQPAVLTAIREAVRDKSMFQLEHRVRRPDGTLAWAYSRAVPLLDENGEIIEWFGAASDVTARKEAEENYKNLAQTLDAEVQERTRELEARNREILWQSEQLRELSWRMLRTQEEERRRIARELHDSAGQTLTVLGMNLSMLVEMAKETAPEITRSAEETYEIVQQLTKDIRTTSYLLHPPLLDENGLPAALSWYIRGLTDRSRLDIAFNISEEFGRLPRDMELVIFRLVQECLTNILRHSGSKSAGIRVLREPERVLVEVRDQGKGIPPEKLAEIQTKGSGVGIRGMRERLRQFQGDLIIESTSAGTIVVVTIPMKETAQLDNSPVNIESRI